MAILGNGISIVAELESDLSSYTGLYTGQIANCLDTGAVKKWNGSSWINPPTFAPANLGTGTADASKFLRGDLTWAAGAGGIPEAPQDAQTYGRNNAAWVVAGGGGVSSVSGTAPIASSGGATPAISLNDAGVTNAKMANMATKTYKGRTTAGTGVPEDVAVATLKTDLALVKGDVGLGSVDNTTDVGKPISTATQTALDLKARTVYNTSVANQGPGFATDTYLTGSSIAIPNSSLRAKSIYRCRIAVTKTGAGTATPIINVRFGVNGTTGDTSRGTLTFSAQTGVIDEGVYEIVVVFRTVGSGTSAVIQTSGQLRHRLSITGFGTGVSEPEAATSGGFDSTVSNSIIGLSVNGGTSAAWTVTQVVAELLNLA